MASNLITITNISKQIIPILVDSIANNQSLAGSTIPASKAEQLTIAPGAELSIEQRRVDIAQLSQLRKLGLITYTTQ